MTIQHIIGIASGVVAFGSYFFYIPAILKGETKPNRASWWIWGTVGALIVVSYYASGARETIWVPVSEAVGPAVIALLSVRFGEGGWTRLDRWCLFGAGIGTFFWWITSSAAVGLVLYLFTDLMAIVPTIKKTLHRPENENKTAWGLTFSGQLLNLFAVERWTFSILLYPLYMIFTNGTIFALQFRKKGDKAFSSIDIVSQCLSDIPRTEAFQKAIAEKVRRGDRVLDVGTGSGILALFASRAGARTVVSLEYDPFVADAARKVIEANAGQHVEVRVGDGRTYQFEPGLTFNAVIMEMLTTGMIDEYQVGAINNLHRQGAVTADTVFLPSRQATFITLGDFDFTCYGLTVPFPRHAWKFCADSVKKFRPLTACALLNSVEFSRVTAERFEACINLTVSKGGVVNSAWLSSVSHLTEEVQLGDTDSLNGPVVIPLPRREVREGDIIAVEVKYRFGGGYQNVTIIVKN